MQCIFSLLIFLVWYTIKSISIFPIILRIVLLVDFRHGGQSQLPTYLSIYSDNKMINTQFTSCQDEYYLITVPQSSVRQSGTNGPRGTMALCPANCGRPGQANTIGQRSAVRFPPCSYVVGVLTLILSYSYLFI